MRPEAGLHAVGLGGEKLLQRFLTSTPWRAALWRWPTTFPHFHPLSSACGCDQFSWHSRERGLNLCWGFKEHVRGFRYPGNEFPGDECLATQSTLLPGLRLWLRSDSAKKITYLTITQLNLQKFGEKTTSVIRIERIKTGLKKFKGLNQSLLAGQGQTWG